MDAARVPTTTKESHAEAVKRGIAAMKVVDGKIEELNVLCKMFEIDGFFCRETSNRFSTRRMRRRATEYPFRYYPRSGLTEEKYFHTFEEAKAYLDEKIISLTK